MTEPRDYDLKPEEQKQPATPRPKPGEPGWVEPVPVVEKADPVPYESPAPEGFDAADIEKNKGLAILAYILFIVPLVAAPQSKFARFHANQGLLLFMLWCLGVLLVIFLYLLDAANVYFFRQFGMLAAFFSCVFLLAKAATLLGMVALMLTGIVRAANGETKGLPLIGHITLIK